MAQQQPLNLGASPDAATATWSLQHRTQPSQADAPTADWCRGWFVHRGLPPAEHAEEVSSERDDDAPGGWMLAPILCNGEGWCFC